MKGSAYLEIDPEYRGAYTRAFLPVYNAFASARPPMALTVPLGFAEAARALYAKIGAPAPMLMERPLPRAECDGSGVIVGFSGGLDSAYVAARLAEAGEDVTLFHLTGLNRQYPDEDAAARAFSEHAGIELVECRVRHAWKEMYPDNPVKNQLVLSLMADHGVRRGVRRYSLGSDWCTPLSECEVGWTLTDSVEVNAGFLASMREAVDGYALEFIPEDVKKVQRVKHLAERGLLAHVSSCITPHRFKRKLAEVNRGKYGVALLDGRCGSCFKCCMEWLLLNHLGMVDPNPAFEGHCWEVLASGKNSHRKDLFSASVPIETRMENLLEYGS